MRGGKGKRAADMREAVWCQVLLACSVAAAVEAWNKTQSGIWAVLAAASPLMLAGLVIIIRACVKRRALLAAGMDEVDHMTGPAFEQMLLVHFQRKGYRGHLTPETADYGADLVLEKDGRKVVVQAKRWRHVVGVTAIQEITAAIKYYGAEKGMVVTNSVFTPNAIQLARVNGIELVSREQLIVMLSSSQKKGRPTSTAF